MAKTTMVVRAGGQMVVNPELLSVIGNKYHVVLTEDDDGNLVLQAVSALLYVEPTAMGKVAIHTCPFTKAKAIQEEG